MARSQISPGHGENPYRARSQINRRGAEGTKKGSRHGRLGQEKIEVGRSKGHQEGREGRKSTESRIIKGRRAPWPSAC